MAKRLSRRELAEYVANQLLDGVSSKKLIQQLAAYLVVHGRRRETELITRDIEASLARHGHVNGSVVSARQLSADARAAVTKLIHTTYPTAEHVTIDETIEPSLIGGMTLDVPGRRLDASVKTKLEQLTI